MKTVFLSAVVLIYGYFCDICLMLCREAAQKSLKKGKPLTGKRLILISNLANNSISRWKRLEKKLIACLACKQNF